jgi:ABC-type uncharacterized transport system substrate-binding protein
MRRRDFIMLLGGAAASPLPGIAAWAQQKQPLRRLGVLMSLAADDKESQSRLAIFARALTGLGWSEGRNLRIDIRWGDDNAERTRSVAAELMTLAPDVLLASGSAAAQALQKATRTAPIVFVQVAEPLGVVQNLARPGGNITGFASIEHGMSATWLELLKEISPGVSRVLVVRDPTSGAGTGQFAAIQPAAARLGVELRAAGVRDSAEIAQAIEAIAREGGGLIVTTSTRASAHRDLMVALAAKHRLPAVYPFRHYAAAGGLISYGADYGDQYRTAAGYVDRVLKGERPAEMPVRAPEKYETVINMRTARTLGFAVPASVLRRADELIQ